MTTSHEYVDTIMLGDMNARLLQGEGGEESIMGPWPFGTAQQLQMQSAETR